MNDKELSQISYHEDNTIPKNNISIIRKKKLQDITGLLAYTPEHDKIMNIQLEVVKNVYCGKSRTPYSHGSGSIEAKEGGFFDYGIWKGFIFSVAVPKEIGLKGYMTPDHEGYAHPITNDEIHRLAEQATGQQPNVKFEVDLLFQTVVDSPRNKDNCRFGFRNQEDAEKFIGLIEENKN